jgi:hypothetical protein
MKLTKIHDYSKQGRRKHEKVGGGGGPVSRGTLGMKRAPKIFFSEMLATGKGGEVV